MIRNTTLALAASTILMSPAFAQFIPSEESLEGFYTGTTYSPYAQRAFPSRVFWGDSHLHTEISLDGGMAGNTLGPNDAYRFAKGEEIVSSTGLPAKLGRPLDWLAVTDHSDMMGFAPDFVAGAPVITQTDQGGRWFDLFSQGGDGAATATLEAIGNFAQGTLDPALVEAYSPGGAAFDDTWQQIIDAAENNYEPGRFTTFIGYEWTSLVSGNNLHRNVLLRDGASRAEQVLPMVTQPPLGSPDPLDLYAWMEMYEEETGGQALAIAHNGNLSNGIMFPVDAQYTGRPLDEFYVEQRARWEPLYEVTQMKGDGETHPLLSPDDAFADYETWDVGNLDLSALKTPDMLSGEYAREALKQGLGLEAKFGTNPYQFGMVGSTDSHTSLSTAEEENYFGKAPVEEPSLTRALHPFAANDNGVFPGWSLVASGYTGVWATENTREAIWDAMARKEVYATTGPRMMVRFFGGWEFDDNDLRSRAPAFAGYEKGVPMGGNLRAVPEGGRGTDLHGLCPPRSGRGEPRPHPDRQGLADAGGRVAGEGVRRCVVRRSHARRGRQAASRWQHGRSGSRQLDQHDRSLGTGHGLDRPGFQPCGRSLLLRKGHRDSDPRWVLYDKVRLGAELPEAATLTGQERAYTSPIWYTPQG